MKNDEKKTHIELWKHTSKTNAIFNDNKNLKKNHIWIYFVIKELIDEIKQFKKSFFT